MGHPRRSKLAILLLSALLRFSTAQIPENEGPKPVKVKIGLIDDSHKVCYSLLKKSFNQIIDEYNVTAEFVKLHPPKTSVRHTVKELSDSIKAFRNHSLSAIFSDFIPTLAEITDELQLPFFTVPLSTRDQPLASSSMIWMYSYDFGLPYAIRDLMKNLKKVQRLVIITETSFAGNSLYVRVLEPLHCDVDYLNFQNGTTIDGFKQQLRSLSLPYTDDVSFLILLNPEDLMSVQTIMWAGLYLGYMNNKQLWLIGSFELSIAVIQPFIHTRSRIITFGLPDQAMIRPVKPHPSRQSVVDELCAQLTYHIMNMEVAPGTNRLAKIRSNVTSIKTGTLKFDGEGRIDSKLKVRGVFWGVPALFPIGNWDKLLSATSVTHRYYTLMPLPVKVGVLIERPFFSYGTNKEPIGFFVDVFKELASRLNWKVTWVVQPEVGRKLKNGTWTGLFGLVKEMKIDIIAATLIAVKEREDIMDFTPAVITEGFSWLAKKEPPPVFWLIYIQPFVSWIWIGLAIVFVLSWLTFFLIELMSPKVKKHHHSTKQQNVPFADGYNFGDVFLVTVSTMTLGKLPVNPRMFSARFFMAILWFFSLMMMLTYTAYLMAYIYQPSSTVSQKGGIEGILDNTAKYRWFWTEGEAAYSEMLDADNGTQAHRLANVALKNWKKDMFRPREQILDVLFTNDTEIFFGENSFVAYNGMTNCSFEYGNKILEPSERYMATRKLFEDSHSLHILLPILKSTIDSMFTRWLNYPNNCPDSKTLDLNVVASLFAVLAGGVIIGILSGITEWLIVKLRMFCIRCRLPKLRFGSVYNARADEVDDHGVLMTVENRPNKYYLPSSQLHLQPIKNLRPRDLGLRPGSNFEVRYFGKDPVSKAKRFVRETPM